MHKNNTVIKGSALLAMIMISLTMSTAPSEAIVSDPSIFTKLKTERNALLNKEQRLMEDYDDLQRQLRDLQNRGTDPREVDQLCRDIDIKYNDLQSVRYSIKNLDLRLL